MIPNSYFSKLRRGAAKRSIPFKLDTDYLATLLLQQKEACALSGVPIRFGNGTASLDRINSMKGYVKGNVQWVHKEINWMKGSMTQDSFFEFCRLVTERKNGNG